MNVLVTGGAGYVGSILVPRLLGLGHVVTVVDNFMYGQCSLLDCCFSDKLTIVRGDVRDRSLMSRLLKGAEVIIPLACLVGAPICDERPFEAKSINHDAVKMILELRSREQRIIFPNTNSGYGVGEQGVSYTEKSPLNPISLYGRLKVDIENAVLDAGNSITFRFATVFGISPRMRIDLLVNDFTYRAVHDRFVVLFEAHFKRNYIHVRDAANAFAHAMEHFDLMKDEAYNVGLSDANLSKWELCEEIGKQVPSFYFVEAAIGEDPDKRNYVVSNDKIEATGFRAEVTLQSGIAELLRGYRIIKNNQYGNI